VNAGLRAAKARGVRLGRPANHMPHRATVAQLVADGQSMRAIARQLGLPVSPVFRIVQRIRAG